MFACSPVETENIFYNPKKSFNNKGESSSSTSKMTPPCNNFYYNALIADNDQQRRRFQQFHEASQKRNQLKQEIQRRHQLCADNERQCRAKAEKQMALKKAEECNALRKFYEAKSAQLKNNNVNIINARNRTDSLRSTLSSTNSSIFSSSSTKNSSRELPSKSSMCASIKKFQAAYKIHSFVKHYIEKRNTEKIISLLIKLRSIQNRLLVLKSINLKVRTLTFDSTHKNKVLPISVNNKGFLLYKESILKVLNQLDADFTDEFYLVRERKQFIKNIANNILKELDNEKNSQYNQFIKKNEVVDAL